jgi:hypothetical protein
MVLPPSVNTQARCSAIRLAQKHAVMLRNHMAKEYFIQYQEGKLPDFHKTLTDEPIALSQSVLLSSLSNCPMSGSGI